MRDLLTHLAGTPAGGRWYQWQIQRIGGSANNILYRATGGDSDLAVKFTIRDARGRARREYNALQALAQAGLDVAPRPILLDETSYALPVVVQSWLDGVVTADPPQSDDEWRQLVGHYATIHTVTPDKVNVPIAAAVLDFDSIAAGHRHIHRQAAAIPTASQPASLKRLLSRLNQSPLLSRPSAPLPRQALCRVDANSLNFIRRPGSWASVDWENAGWGDPAFEVVDLMCHPQYDTVPVARWHWLIALYAQLTGDLTAVARIWSYYPLMLVWWAARLARMLYEVPRGLDGRLVVRPPGWQSDIQAKFDRYVQLATAALNYDTALVAGTGSAGRFSPRSAR